MRAHGKKIVLGWEPLLVEGFVYVVCWRIGNLFWARDWFRYCDNNDRFWFSVPVGARFVALGAIALILDCRRLHFCIDGRRRTRPHWW